MRNAVVVINLPREGSPNVAIQHLREYFLARCRAVHVIPYDPHLAEGAEIDLARLHKNTKRALVELAATVAALAFDGLAGGSAMGRLRPPNSATTVSSPRVLTA